MSFSIDINCDLGEGFPHDSELMKYISSANIACGFHAGDRDTMRRTVGLAIENNVAIGAHPGYPDRENFGRTSMSLTPERVCGIVSEQILVLKAICEEMGVNLNHVKPHGALYNQSAKDSELAAAIADAVNSIEPQLILFGLSGSVSISAAMVVGLRTASETFADRTYQPDGVLTPRSHPNALIENDDDAIAQALGFVQNGTVAAVTGEIVKVRCDTICIHGDGEHAVSFAKKIREAFENEGIEIKPLL